MYLLNKLRVNETISCAAIITDQIAIIESTDNSSQYNYNYIVRTELSSNRLNVLLERMLFSLATFSFLSVEEKEYSLHRFCITVDCGTENCCFMLRHTE